MAEPKDVGTMEEGYADQDREDAVRDAAFHGPTLKEMLEDPRWSEPILLIGPMPDGGITPQFVEEVLSQVFSGDESLRDRCVAADRNRAEDIMKDNITCPDYDPRQTPAQFKSSDPWRGRNAHMRCRTCMFRNEKTETVGRCRRHAPTMNGYPVIFLDTDWCGDHKLDEEAM